ncbi:predicted protein [Arabidopsis lyrata subsp. lyrata]|uniref:Predicted protein n=1 Tax=Arabidopsis lyrata subsp. lyrata TaxID=81972 RepID=D7LNP5_ARALL|nr:uncharacterized protein LOC9311718 isoform X2 [Arabidopsis lyrata subsp. lyrata]EFH51909.1 predicted protein [Arabidopsis lyrata subsp. lyrata]|eukprot:XP_002875650.1 uncharacterized protein LOC9311718 isoform X2 [Arabidopsis lyrata subsp. lyrata]
MSWSQITPRDPNLTTWSQITSRDPNATTEDGDGDGERDHPLRNYCIMYVVLLDIFGFWLFVLIGLINISRCYLDLFVDSVSVSNNTNWSVSLVADSPFTFCQLSLFTVNGHLLQGVAFTTRKLDGVKEGHVIWDTAVKIIARIEVGTSLKKNGLLRVTCSDLPVRFWLDPERNMKGSLVGNRKRCNYLFKSSLDQSR